MSLEWFLIVNLVFLVIFSIYDVITWSVPDYLVLFYMVFAGVVLIFSDNKLYNVLGFLEFIFIIGVLYVYAVSRRNDLLEMFGAGDIKILFGFSFVVGGEGFVFSLAIGTLLGVLYGLARKVEKVPFVPFLTLGYIFYLVFWFIKTIDLCLNTSKL